MTPVISPWVFYLMHLADRLETLLLVVLIASGIAAIVSFVFYNDAYEEEDLARYKKCLKTAFVASVASGVVLSFIPGSATITKMLIAQNVTYERVEMATDTVQSVYEDIMGLFGEEDDG